MIFKESAFTLYEIPFQKKHVSPAPGTHRHLSTPIEHVLIFLPDVSQQAVHSSKKGLESVSDSITRPGINLFYGSIAGTINYFGDLATIREELVKHFNPLEESFKPKIILSSQIYAGYVLAYAIKRDDAIVIADRSNIEYRKIREALSWDEWHSASRSFLDLLTLKASEHQKACKGLKDFCANLKKMRFKRPSEVPLTLPLQDFARRFGEIPTILWREWQDDSRDSFKDKLKRLPEDLNSTDFATSLNEAESYCDKPVVPISESENAFKEIFYHCLEKFKCLSTSSIQFGLGDFRIEVEFNDGIKLEKDVSLTKPIFQRDKYNDLVLDNVISSLPTAKTEIASPKDPSFFVFVTRLEEMRIVPTNLSFEVLKQYDLFCENFDKVTVDVLKDRLLLRDQVSCPTLLPQSNIFDRRTFLQMNEDRNFLLFRDAFTSRPICEFKTPIPVRMRDITRKGHSIVFAETLQEYDYFNLYIDGGDSFWMRSLTITRSDCERNFEIIGFVDNAYV